MLSYLRTYPMTSGGRRGAITDLLTKKLDIHVWISKYIHFWAPTHDLQNNVILKV